MSRQFDEADYNNPEDKDLDKDFNEDEDDEDDFLENDYEDDKDLDDEDEDLEKDDLSVRWQRSRRRWIRELKGSVKHTTTSDITHYTGLLHRHGVGSDQAKAYREKHALDEHFQHRCSVMDQVFQLSRDLQKTEGQGHG